MNVGRSRVSIAFIVCAASLGAAAQQAGDSACPRIAIGADVSFLPQAEAQGTVFRDQGVAALIATHNMELAGYMDRVFALKDGQLIEQR